MLASRPDSVTTLHPDRIYCKTDKGRQEVTARTHGLLARQRSALILIDCAKTVGILANVIPLEELRETVPFLMERGFVVLADSVREQVRMATAAAARSPLRTDPVAANPAGKPASAGKPAPAVLTSSAPVLTQNVAVVHKVKEFMMTMANTHLGLMGADTIARIQRCHTAEQLLAAAAFWHMALRESKTGTVYASAFLEQVKFELREGN